MTKQKTYAAIRAELDEVIERFERSAHTDVDELLKDYEKGKTLLAELEAMLDSAELKIKKATDLA